MKASAFDKKFDAGKDVTQYLDLQNIKRVTPLNLADISHLSPFFSSLEKSLWTLEKIRSCLEHKDYRAWKLEIQNQIIAYILFNIAGDEVHIMWIAVHPEQRQKGYGQYLLENTLHEITKFKKKAVILEVNENNQAAIQLYEKCGFEQIGLRKDYYLVGTKREAALVYTKKMLEWAH
jgi:ribosomal-protein-alanine acetyltransferase